MDSILRGLESGTRLVDQLRAEKFRRPAAADVVARLAALSPIEYDQQRDAAARQLHCRVGTLDEEVRRVRARTAAEAEAPVVVQDDEPWPYEVNGADLLDCLRTFAQRFLVLPDRGADVIALWSLFTHCIESVSVAPILAITSPTKRCGKTAVIDLLKLLCRRGLAASSITAAALFRSVEKWAPTLLIDEADTFLRDHDELRGILNSGHTRSSAFVIRCAGDAYEPTRYTTWCAKAIALIGKLPDTLEDRSIAVAMRRKLPSENVERLRHADVAEFVVLRRKCARWARDNTHRLRSARPESLRELNDRAMDSWEPLIAIADIAGGRWPELAREAAIAISGGELNGHEISIELLRDMRAAFDELGERIWTEDLIKYLCCDPDARWCEYGRAQKKITSRHIAALLEPFGIGPRELRIGARTTKGYHREWFADVFARFLPQQDTPSRQLLGSHPQQSNICDESMAYEVFSSATDPTMLRIENDDKHLYSNDCCPVADINTHGAEHVYTPARGSRCPRCDGEGCCWCRTS